MKFKFDAKLNYQLEAIKSVTDLFDGQLISKSTFQTNILTNQFMGTSHNELGLSNKFFLDKDEEINSWLLNNLRVIQERNQIIKSTKLEGKNFSIEMETGTGKTYVYLRTIFELNKLYGFKKFVIIVPSIAIKEVVLSSINDMKEHFNSIYNVPFNYIFYNSNLLNDVRQFSTTNSIQILIVTIQAFIKSENRMNIETDKLFGREPIEFISKTRPIIIIDEPQNMETEKSKAAITKMEPLFTLRYSATHKDLYNQVYKLDPIKAYDLRLVKRIEVASVIADDNINDSFIELVKIDNLNNKLKAKININYSSNNNSVSKKTFNVKINDNLFDLSNGRQEYKNNFIIKSISANPGNEFIQFNNGKVIKKGEVLGNFNDEIFKAQIYETIKQHFNKINQLKDKKIKVLSLFFLDSVSDYRIYNENGSNSLGKIGKFFEEMYEKCTKEISKNNFTFFNVSKVHDGYFSKDKKGQFKDSKENINDSDEDTYSKIMRDKAGLLSLSEPLQFIFTHSALREGWDNPNIFQICTLRRSGSQILRRQTIGRGLRLCRDQNGDRVHDDNINRLTIIANESYKEFAEQLQTEYENDYGINFLEVPINIFAKLFLLDSEGKNKEIGEDGSKEIFDKLILDNYLDPQFKVTNKFDPNDQDLKLLLPYKYETLSSEVFDILNNYQFKNRITDNRNKKKITYNKKINLNSEFRLMWEQISKKTTFKVKFDTSKLIEIAVNKFKKNLLDNNGKIQPLKIYIDVANIEAKSAGVFPGLVREQSIVNISKKNNLPDILSYLQNSTGLTRNTLVEILIKSGRLDEFIINPQAFISMATKEIAAALDDLILDTIVYEKIPGEGWAFNQLEKYAESDLIRYLNNLYLVINKDKTAYDYVEVNKKVEQDFARDLDSNERIEFFIKLPNWFKIDTPIGTYNPDWAFFFRDIKKIYFIRETKDTLDSDERRKSENYKIKCATKHFEAISDNKYKINFAVATSLKEVISRLNE